jgi:hypothetical protein
MIKNSSRRREPLLLRLDESAREVMAAWFLVLFVVAAGLSILAIHRYSLVDCTTAVAMPGTHYRLTVEQEWDDPACSIGSCGNWQSAQEIDLDSMRAAQNDSGDATPVYTGSSTPVSLQGNIGNQDERLC